MTKNQIPNELNDEQKSKCNQILNLHRIEYDIQTKIDNILSSFYPKTQSDPHYFSDSEFDNWYHICANVHTIHIDEKSVGGGISWDIILRLVKDEEDSPVLNSKWLTRIYLSDYLHHNFDNYLQQSVSEAYSKLINFLVNDYLEVKPKKRKLSTSNNSKKKEKITKK